MLDDVQHILKVHVRNACEPMHQPLKMWLAADIIPLGVKEASEENLHLNRTAQLGGLFEAIRVECWCRLGVGET